MKLSISFIILLLLFSCDFNVVENLGSGYSIYEYNDSKVVVKKAGEGYEEIITAEVKDYDYDKNFIIVYREITARAVQLFRSHEKWESQSGDSIQYWIVDKNTDSTYGPLNWTEFSNERKRLKVPIGLKFRNMD